MSNNCDSTPKVTRAKEPLLERAVQLFYTLEDSPNYPRRDVNLTRVLGVISRFTPGN